MKPRDLSKEESLFESVRDTLDEPEVERIVEKREGDQAEYGHDLFGAVQKGIRRKVDAAFDEAAQWTRKDLYLPGKEWTPNDMFWHLLSALVRWAERKGADKAKMQEQLQRRANLTDWR